MSQSPPLALLKALVRPYGARLTRRQRSYHYSNLAGMHYDGRSWVENAANYSYSSISSPFGGLFDSDFFYWWGSDRKESNYSMCRVCRTVTFGPREREMHLNSPTHQCRRYIYNAFEVLRRDKRCAVCDKVTERIRLGVYLCGFPCEDFWKFEPTKSDRALREALRIVGWKED